MRMLVVALFALALPAIPPPLSFHVESKNVAWKPMKLPGVPDGLQQRLLHENKDNGHFSAVVKFPKGFREPRHYHTTCGHSMYILRGRLRGPNAVYTPGTFIFAAKHERHGPFVAEQETEFVFYNDGPFDFFVEEQQ